MTQNTKVSDGSAHIIRANVSEFTMPPIHDALVLGRNAPIGCNAFRRAIDLLMIVPFEHIEFEDDTIGDILVRASILRRIPSAKLMQFILRQIKPLMADNEVLHLDLDVRATIEGSV